MRTFDQALKNSLITKQDRLKEFFDLDDERDLEKVVQQYRDKVENHKKNIDMTNIFYRKAGLNEYKADKFKNDPAKIVPMGTRKSGKDLFGNYQMYDEIQIPECCEDEFGNIYVRDRQG